MLDDDDLPQAAPASPPDASPPRLADPNMGALAKRRMEGQEKAPAKKRGRKKQAQPPPMMASPPRPENGQAPPLRLTSSPPGLLSGQEQQQKLRINASGRVATLLEKKQRGWLVVELDENQGEDGAPFEQRSIRSNFVTFLDSAGNDVIPTKKKRKRPSVPAIAPPAPGQQPVSFAQVSDQNRPRSGSVDLDAPPPPKPKKRTKRNKVEYNTGDRIRVVEHAKYQGLSLIHI